MAGDNAGLALAAVFAAAALNSVAFYLVPTQLPFHLAEIGAAAPSRAGLAIGLFSLASATVALGYGRLRHHLGLTGMFALGFALMALGYGLIAIATSYGGIVLATVVTGIGMGCVMPNLGAAAMALAPATMRGRVAGGLTASIFIGQFISPLMSQPWIATFGYAAAFRDTGVLLAVMACTAGVAGLYARRDKAARIAGI